MFVFLSEVTIVATQPPTRPHPRPNTGETQRTNPLAKTQNTTLDGGQSVVGPLTAVGTTVTISVSTARTPPSKPARNPAASGSPEWVAATLPAMNAPIIITLPPIVASEFGSTCNIAATGSEAAPPTSAKRHASGSSCKREEDFIRCGSIPENPFISCAE